MSEQVELTESDAFHYYAEQYKDRKEKTLINLLECGKILYESKKTLSHGQFTIFLEDHRVSESPRTSQRLMSVYKNFRHLLDMKDRPESISQLGVSHLLELQKLPERFRKEIEIIEGESSRIVKVIDEEILVDFLEKKVEVNGENVPIRELGTKEMRRYINEEQGIYEPTQEQLFDEDQDINIENENPDTVPIQLGEFEDHNAISSDMARQTKDRFREVLINLSSLVTLSHNTRKQVQEFDRTELEMLDEPEKEKLKRHMTEAKKAVESLFVQLDGGIDIL